MTDPSSISNKQFCGGAAAQKPKQEVGRAASDRNAKRGILVHSHMSGSGSAEGVARGGVRVPSTTPSLALSFPLVSHSHHPPTANSLELKPLLSPPAHFPFPLGDAASPADRIGDPSSPADRTRLQGFVAGSDRISDRSVA
jgi:hypothetical protein